MSVLISIGSSGSSSGDGVWSTRHWWVANFSGNFRSMSRFVLVLVESRKSFIWSGVRMPRLSSISNEFCFFRSSDDDGDDGCGPLPVVANESHRSIEQSKVQSGRSRPNEYR